MITFYNLLQYPNCKIVYTIQLIFTPTQSFTIFQMYQTYKKIQHFFEQVVHDYSNFKIVISFPTLNFV